LNITVQNEFRGSWLFRRVADFRQGVGGVWIWIMGEELQVGDGGGGGGADFGQGG
jgi:hypothetical protein